MDEILNTLSMVIGKNEAKVLIFLSKNEKGYSSEIEQDTKLRQPEASVATKNLLKLHLIGKKEVKNKGKGRPRYLFSMNESAKETLLKRVTEKEKTITDIRKIINDLF
jgi:predicted transcriptional regulator